MDGLVDVRVMGGQTERNSKKIGSSLQTRYKPRSKGDTGRKNPLVDATEGVAVCQRYCPTFSAQAAETVISLEPGQQLTGSPKEITTAKKELKGSG